jgi:hypothetical protein
MSPIARRGNQTKGAFGWPPQRLQTASLLFYVIFSPQTPQSARNEHKSTEGQKSVSGV